MVKKIAACVLALIVLLICAGCNRDPFQNDNVKIKAYQYSVQQGDCMDDILGTFYEHNTVFVDWASYRQKHSEINAELTRNGRFLQVGDKVIVFTLHKKER